jgi:hypothetical protein
VERGVGTGGDAAEAGGGKDSRRQHSGGGGQWASLHQSGARPHRPGGLLSSSYCFLLVFLLFFFLFSFCFQVIEVSDRESIALMYYLYEEEGIFAGGSSGLNVCAALKYALQHPDSHVVTIVCDSGLNYLEKFWGTEVREKLDLPPTIDRSNLMQYLNIK